MRKLRQFKQQLAASIMLGDLVTLLGIIFIVLSMLLAVLQKDLVKKVAKEVGEAAAANGRADDAEEEAGEQGKRADDAEDQAGDGKDRADRAEDEADRYKQQLKDLVAGVPVDLVVHVDTTGSMSKALDELRNTLRVTAEIMVGISPEFRIGVIAYQGTIVAEYPLTQILDSADDGGKSLQLFNDFIDSLEATGGMANVPLALSQGLRSLDRGNTSKRRQVLMLLGDVDCSEASQSANVSQQSLEDKICREIQQWGAKANTDRRVISFFSSPNGATNPFYERLATLVPHGTFSNDVLSMLKSVLQTTLAERKE